MNYHKRTFWIGGWVMGIIFAFQTCHAAEYYVSPDGVDGAGRGLTRETPWQTLAYASANLPAGNTLVLLDGTYSGPASSNRLRPPSGTVENYTVIKADHDGQAIIDGSQMTGIYEYPVDIDAKNYLQLEGLAIRNKSNSSLLFIYNASYVKVLRSSVINKVNYEGSIVFIGGDSHHILLEDVWVTGAGRYDVIILKPTAYAQNAPHQIILRRVVTRHDYRRRDDPPNHEQQYPVCGIQVYGEQNGDEGVAVTRDVMVQNSLALDFNYGTDHWQLSGGLCEVARCSDVSWLGNIVMNIKGESNSCLPDYNCSYPSTFNGFSFADNRLNDGGNFIFRNNISWDTSGAGFQFGSTSYDTVKTLLIDGNTVGQVSGYINHNTESGDSFVTPRAVMDSYSTLEAIVKNSLFFQTGQSSPGYGPNPGGSYAESFSWYYPASLVNESYATNYVTTNPAIEYITQTPDAGTGEGGNKRGAEVLKKYGIDGTLWGETGYDQLTGNNLWPWPYEDQIKAAFSETNNPSVNSYPATNDTERGFCASGNGLYGGSVTLTSYIWEYLGNPCPENICNYDSEPDLTSPSAPVGLLVE